MRLWALARAPMTRPPETAEFAQRAEADGWDGLMFPDNQNLWGDTFVSMTLAAMATKKLLICNASTNSGTRHPAVMASAAAAVNRVAGGRVSLGIARGDSALAHLGAAPVAVSDFAAYLGVLRAFLAGQEVSFEELERWRPSASSAGLPLSGAPASSRLHWLDPGEAVTIRVFASGPAAIEIGARYADQIIFGLGADTRRLAWGVGLAREVCQRIGRDAAELSFGALMSVAVSDDREFARSLVANIVASSARFSSIHGRVAGPVDDEQRRIYTSLATAYDMNAHGETGAQVRVLTPEFIDAFAVVGAAGECLDRLRGISHLGVDDVLLIAPRNDTEAAGERSSRALVADLLPAARSLG